MVRKLWQVKWIFLVIAMLAAFATCVKEKDPYQDRNDIKNKLTEITAVINQKSLQGLNACYSKSFPAAQGPNALLAVISLKTDSSFQMHKRKFSIDEDRATIRFTFSPDSGDSSFSYLTLVKNGEWKIAGFEIE